MERSLFVGFSPSAGAAPCADCIGYPLKALNWNDKTKKGGEAHIPCPHYNITIIARGKVKGNSVVGAAAYQSGDKLYSEYEHEWKSGDHQERIIHKEILLPPNAPEKYRDRATLWNAVDAAEDKSTAQTARRIIMALPKELSQEQNIELIRNYCQASFVDRGMIADFAVHDDKEGNPHAHVLLTMRSLNEHGEWNPKTRTEFVLDENGERIQTANGKYKRRCVSWDGWNDRGNCEIWRHEWEVMQNAALEQAGRMERVDMRSFERQGIELAPTIHLGPAAFALEKKGIHTELGDQNRAVKIINALFTAIRNKLKALRNWLTELSEIISDHEKLESPGDYPLLSVLMAYYDLREKERWDWSYGARNKGGINDLKEKASVFTFLRENDIYSINDFGRLLNDTSARIREMESMKKTKEKRIRDIDDIIDAVKTLKELNPIREKYNSINYRTKKEKYGQEHAAELDRIKKAQGLLHKLNVTLPINKKTLREESAQLSAEVEAMLPELESVKVELDKQMKIRSHVRKVLPAALTFKDQNGQKRFEDVSEEVQNQEELKALLEASSDQAIRRSEDFEEKNPTFTQQPANEHQTKERQKNWQKGGR
jgi:hypothetical protein